MGTHPKVLHYIKPKRNVTIKSSLKAAYFSYHKKYCPKFFRELKIPKSKVPGYNDKCKKWDFLYIITVSKKSWKYYMIITLSTLSPTFLLLLGWQLGYSRMFSVLTLSPVPLNWQAHPLSKMGEKQGLPGKKTKKKIGKFVVSFLTASKTKWSNFSLDLKWNNLQKSNTNKKISKNPFLFIANNFINEHLATLQETYISSPMANVPTLYYVKSNRQTNVGQVLNDLIYLGQNITKSW